MQAALSKKERSLTLLRDIIDQEGTTLLACPYCHRPLNLVDQALRCDQGHHFDMAKQGYYYLTNIAQDSKYDQALLQARRKVIRDSDLFKECHRVIQQVITDRFSIQDQALNILDAGSGEGSHLAQLVATWPKLGLAAGVDLSKQGVQLASDYNGRFLSLVGDIANLPFQDDSFHVILSILSPSNYDEFLRLAHPGESLLLKLVPNPAYLQEIRQGVQALTGKSLMTYDNKPVLEGLRNHFHQSHFERISYTLPMSPEGMANLVEMTPLTWQLSPELKASLVEDLNRQGTITADWTLAIVEGMKA